MLKLINIKIKTGERWFLAATILIVFLSFVLFSLVNHWHFGTGYDLAIFDQAVWHYSRFEVPVSTILEMPSVLADHLHPILVVLAPLYWFFPRAETLLVAQAALVASTILPLYLALRQRLNFWPAFLLVLCFPLFWGIQHMVTFDFHEVAFAVPLIAWLIYWLDTKNWRAVWVGLLLLLLVKENMALLVLAFGLLIISKGELRRGSLAVGLGALWFLLATKLLIPYFSVTKSYNYWTYSRVGATPLAALKTILFKPWQVITVFLTPEIKADTLLGTFRQFLFFPFLSPLVILMIPLLAERFLSDKPLLWARNFHYSATLAPILIVATADTILLLSSLLKDKVQQTRANLLLAGAVLLFSLPQLTTYLLWKSLVKPQFYTFSIRDQVGKRVAELVPPEASVIAQVDALPHFSEREYIYMLKTNFTREADYIVATAQGSSWPNPSYENIDQYLKNKEAAGYKKILDEEGWTVLKKDAP